jgi:hypothetical protein
MPNHAQMALLRCFWQSIWPSVCKTFTLYFFFQPTGVPSTRPRPFQPRIDRPPEWLIWVS